MIEIDGLQYAVMCFVKKWANKEKTPVPKKILIKHMALKKVKDYQVLQAVDTLLKKGYLRKAYSYTERTIYVMCRSI